MRDGIAASSDFATAPRGGAESANGEIATDETATGETAIRDAELLLASLRTLLLIALAIAPRVLQIPEAYGRDAIILMGVAGIYNIFAIIASVYPARFRLRRVLVVAMDATLISAWVHIAGRWDLIPFYYVVVVVAAMWYRVLGGVIMAATCNFLWLLLWARMAATVEPGRIPYFTASMALNSVLFFVIGALAGYVAEAQDREREKSLERELLIANYQQEIDLSGELQPLLLSRLDPGGGGASGLDIGAALQSARAVGGGDYLDAIPLPDERTLLCIADVAGKSIRAQARVPLLKYSLRALAPLHPQPAELMARLQLTLLPDLGAELYIAVCLVVVDARAQTLCWCNAGHLAPLLVRGALAENTDEPLAENAPANDASAPGIRIERHKRARAGAEARSRSEAVELVATAPALGLFPELEISQRSVPWEVGDALLMFTDGLPDALSFGGEIDGEAQVRKLALGLREKCEAGAATPTSAEAAQELVGLAGVALGDKPFVARHFTFAARASSNHIHRDDVAVLVARNTKTIAN